MAEIQEARTEKKGNNDSHMEAHTEIGLYILVPEVLVFFSEEATHTVPTD